MATRVPDSPSAYTGTLLAAEGLSFPHSGIIAPQDTQLLPLGATHVPAEYPALCHDFIDAQHDLFATTSDCNAFIAPFDRAGIDAPDHPWSHLTDAFGLSWANDLDVGAGDFSQPVTQFKRSKRSASLSPSPDFLKRRKRTHKSSIPPTAEQPASPRHDQLANQLVMSQQPLEAVHTDVQLLGLPSTTPAMTEEAQKSKRSLQCAFRVAQAKLKLPYTCTAGPVPTVSALRTHLTRKLPKEKPPHLPFLKLCRTCNEDILDKNLFETFHGTDGLKCENPQPQRKGDAGQQEQYNILCSKVEAFLVVQSNREQEERSGSTIPVDPSHSVGATEDPKKDSTPFFDVVLTDQSTKTSSDVGRTELHQNLHRDHGPRLAPTTATSNSVNQPDTSTSYSSYGSEVAYSHPFCDSLTQDVTHEDIVVADCTDDDIPLKDVVTTTEPFPVREPTSEDRRPIFHVRYAVRFPEDPAQRQFSPLMDVDSPVAQPPSYPSYSTPLNYTVTSCTSSDFTPSLPGVQGIPSWQTWQNLYTRPDWALSDEQLSSANVSDHRPISKRIEMYDYSKSAMMHDRSEMGPPTPGDFEPTLSAPVSLSNVFNHPRVACSECGKSFSGRYGRGNLKRHISAFHDSKADEEGTACRVCKKVYRRADATRKHEWVKHRIPDARPERRAR